MVNVPFAFVISKPMVISVKGHAERLPSTHNKIGGNKKRIIKAFKNIQQAKDGANSNEAGTNPKIDFL